MKQQVKSENIDTRTYLHILVYGRRADEPRKHLSATRNSKAKNKSKRLFIIIETGLIAYVKRTQ